MAGTRFDLDPSIAVLLRDLDISPALVLRRAGLPADLLSRGASELDPADYYRFWEAIAREAERHGTATEAAVAIGEAISVEHFSPPLFAALSSQDLRTAAERLAVYKPLIGPVALVVDSASDLTIAYRWPTAPEPPVLLAMAEILFWVALARLATREPVRPVRVTMPQIPTDPGVLEDHLGARVRTGDAWSVTFSQADATRPFLTENEGDVAGLRARAAPPARRSRRARKHPRPRAFSLGRVAAGGRSVDRRRHPAVGDESTHSATAAQSRGDVVPGCARRDPREPRTPLSRAQ
ncbi:AraC family transcriptional regulator ligand-binding domain-containing protein [Brevibacterium sp. XM4083]|uniref:AraC family transcriptional regulator ligand-binding domain-containing protein n=1 Tax=Brevibacterium sp. XM4083 TaxID=2583238 RepID=UPI001C64389D|nr:AraC family transcriptional regulator ligand-binding domain-containing protein [Brevibacterium sp. XM4083]MCM1012327.1 AraC family transcriptional regulator [Brevibacterium sp. XM4083]